MKVKSRRYYIGERRVAEHSQVRAIEIEVVNNVLITLYESSNE